MSQQEVEQVWVSQQVRVIVPQLLVWADLVLLLLVAQVPKVVVLQQVQELPQEEFVQLAMLVQDL